MRPVAPAPPAGATEAAQWRQRHPRLRVLDQSKYIKRCTNIETLHSSLVQASIRTPPETKRTIQPTTENRGGYPHPRRGSPLPAHAPGSVTPSVSSGEHRTVPTPAHSRSMTFDTHTTLVSDLVQIGSFSSY